MSPETNWLHCTVLEGLFPDEVSVQAQSLDGQTFSLYANSRLLRNPETRSGKNLLKVSVVDLNELSAHIVLPQESFELGNLVQVERSQLLSMK